MSELIDEQPSYLRRYEQRDDTWLASGETRLANARPFLNMAQMRQRLNIGGYVWQCNLGIPLYPQHVAGERCTVAQTLYVFQTPGPMFTQPIRASVIGMSRVGKTERLPAGSVTVMDAHSFDMLLEANGQPPIGTPDPVPDKRGYYEYIVAPGSCLVIGKEAAFGPLLNQRTSILTEDQHLAVSVDERKRISITNFALAQSQLIEQPPQPYAYRVAV